MADNKQYDTQYWIGQLSKVQLPVLSGVMKELNAVAQSDASSADQLSEIILRDAALTAKVLRVANSVYHNPSADNPISTISRAVVQLGFQGIKAISLSVMLVDSLLKKRAKTRMLEWMARGFHSAVQAESLMRKKGSSEESEQVFITALLLHIGDMALWASQDQRIKQLDQELNAHCATDTELERELLGSSIKDISIALANEWKLGDQLLEALCPGAEPSLATQAVLLGEQISLAAEQGWDSPQCREVLAKASLFSGFGIEETQKMLEAGAQHAATVAESYGAGAIREYLPTGERKAAEVPGEVAAEEVVGDPQLQLDVLREMGTLAEQNIDVNTLFQMVVEGVHRGVGLERVALCLVDPRGQAMAAKYVLGQTVDLWKEDLAFPVKSEQDNVFAHCLHSRQCLWFRPGQEHSLEHLINKKTARLVDVHNCLIASVYAGNRPVGIIVADRGVDGSPITLEQFESFEHFAQQTSVSLALLASKRVKRNR